MITAVIVYTPIGSRLPISNPRLEAEYGKQIREIQEGMEFLLHQLNDLRGYNLRLRRAMGEKISPEDSGLIAGGEIDTTFNPEDFPSGLDDEDTPQGQTGPGMMASLSQPGPAGPPVWEAGTVAEFPLSPPANGFLTREFEPDEFHFGIDYACREGSPVWSAAPGRVIFSGWTSEDGNMLMVAHYGGYVTVYKHNKTLLKSVGDEVKRGEMVALSGNTGKSSGPHLHFEVWKDGRAMNAVHYLLTTP